jgi:amidohydrolase
MSPAQIPSLIDELYPRAVALRHALHRVPELAFDEVQTAQLIRDELSHAHIPFTKGPPDAPTATIAVIGDPQKPCIALRADIDALPITEATGLPYASTHPGRMHACGHDGHAANLALVASILKRLENDLPVCVKCIWQPAEEGGGGAERLVKAGVLNGSFAGPPVTEIYGLHGWPLLDVGTVSTRPGPLLASTDTFIARFRGKGGHGAYPHLCVDPILMAAQFVTTAQTIVAREIDPTESCVVSMGKFHAGTAINVIPDEAVVEGTIRTLNPQTRAVAVEAVRRRAQGIAAAGGGAVDFKHNVGYPATINDEAATQKVEQIAAQVVGPTHYLRAPKPSMGGEDFAYYGAQAKACFFLVGVKPPGQDSYPGLHTDTFDFTDAALKTAARIMLHLATTQSANCRE